MLPERLVASAHSVASCDVDYGYETTAKMLHSAVIDFVSRAQLAAVPEQTEELFALRHASRDVVEGINAAKHLHKNLARYSSSDSEVTQRG